MIYNPEIHHRRSIRLKEYDYSQQGLYFITICTKDRLCFFGRIENEEMILNQSGQIANKCILAIPDHFPQTRLHQFIVMPNHVHFIVEFVDVGANNYSPLQDQRRPHGTSKTIGSIVGGFKIGVTKWFREYSDIRTVWQRNYYENVIRDAKSFVQKSEYIQYNALKWKEDRYFVKNNDLGE